MDEKDYKTSEDLAKNESSIYKAIVDGLEEAKKQADNKED